MTVRRHIDRMFDVELDSLRDWIKSMGAAVMEMISRGTSALIEGDPASARWVIDKHGEINRLENQIDRACVRIIALRQPVASDLRFVTMAFKLVTDLERMGDLAVRLCERSIELGRPDGNRLENLAQMSREVLSMVESVLAAFASADVIRAEGVVARDRVVDALFAQLSRDLLEEMTANPKLVGQAMTVQAIAKYLERIGDHAMSAAEMIVFMVDGRDLRVVRRTDSKATPVRGVLFFCVRNAARSQIAEGWAWHLLPPGIAVWSAGSQPADEIDPDAVRVMAESGIDISKQRPKPVSIVPLSEVDAVITLSGEETGLDMRGNARRETWLLPDPAAVSGTLEEKLEAYRRTSLELRSRVERLAQELEQAPSTP
jgi:phosphate transport system protein